MKVMKKDANKLEINVKNSAEKYYMLLERHIYANVILQFSLKNLLVEFLIRIHKH